MNTWQMLRTCHAFPCSPGAIARYRQRSAGPLLDRIDIHIDVPRVDLAYRNLRALDGAARLAPFPSPTSTLRSRRDVYAVIGAHVVAIMDRADLIHGASDLLSPLRCDDRAAIEVVIGRTPQVTHYRTSALAFIHDHAAPRRNGVMRRDHRVGIGGAILDAD